MKISLAEYLADQLGYPVKEIETLIKEYYLTEEWEESER